MRRYLLCGCLLLFFSAPPAGAQKSDAGPSLKISLSGENKTRSLTDTDKYTSLKFYPQTLLSFALLSSDSGGNAFSGTGVRCGRREVPLNALYKDTPPALKTGTRLSWVYYSALMTKIRWEKAPGGKKYLKEIELERAIR